MAIASAPTPAAAPERKLPDNLPTRPAPPAGGPPEATPESLDRSLRWRSRVLLDTSNRGEPSGDGPEVVEAILRGGADVIRQPPAAAQRALAVVHNPDSSLHDLVGLFESDPTLTQSLLKTANSAWYHRSGSSSIFSISQAVQRIGTRGVENVLVSNIVQGLLCRPGGRYEEYVTKVWSHMLRTASLARQMAPAFRIDGDIAYTLALLHDVGKLVIFDYITALRRSLRRDVVIPDSFFSRLLEHLHEPIGGQALLHWNLGAGAADTVSNHHRRVVHDCVDPMTEMVFVTERMDLANIRQASMDWQAVWETGRITADRAAVEAICLEEAA